VLDLVNSTGASRRLLRWAGKTWFKHGTATTLRLFPSNGMRAGNRARRPSRKEAERRPLAGPRVRREKSKGAASGPQEPGQRWIDERLGELWNLRGPYPGFGSFRLLPVAFKQNVWILDDGHVGDFLASQLNSRLVAGGGVPPARRLA
jgi:hypothetical protein